MTRGTCTNFLLDLKPDGGEAAPPKRALRREAHDGWPTHDSCPGVPRLVPWAGPLPWTREGKPRCGTGSATPRVRHGLTRGSWPILLGPQGGGSGAEGGGELGSGSDGDVEAGARVDEHDALRGVDGREEGEVDEVG